MRLRSAILVAFVALVLSPFSVGAQAGKTPRIGVLLPAEPASPTEPSTVAFRQGLRDLGYVEGQNVAVEYRYAHGKAGLYAELVGQLVRLQVDIMVVGSGTATLAAKNATHTIPIVFVAAGDPIGEGLVPSLSRPGGNVTGFSQKPGGGFFGKWAELLKEAAPGISRVGLLREAGNPFTALYGKDFQTAALGLTPQILEVRELQELDGVLATFSRQRGGSLIVEAALFFPHRSQVTDLALKYQLPAIYSWRLFAEAGGLMSYGTSLPDLWRRAATYVDKIFRGAKPADLPVEEPTKFELIINMRTAKALGLTIPQSLLLRADQLIE